MNDKELQEIKEVLSKATSGNWMKFSVGPELYKVTSDKQEPWNFIADRVSEHDAYLIANSPSWLRLCLSTIEVLTKRNEDMLRVLESVKADIDTFSELTGIGRGKPVEEQAAEFNDEIRKWLNFEKQQYEQKDALRQEIEGLKGEVTRITGERDYFERVSNQHYDNCQALRVEAERYRTALEEIAGNPDYRKDILLEIANKALGNSHET